MWTPSGEEDRRAITLSWDLTRYNNDLDGASPADAAIIAWEDDQFGHVDGSTDNYSKLHFGEDKQETRSGYLDIDSEPVIEDPPNAIAGKIHDYKDLPWWDHSGESTLRAHGATGAISIELRKQGDTAGRIATKYAHTWSVVDTAQLNLAESVSIGRGPVSISVDIPTGADSWDITDHQDE